MTALKRSYRSVKTLGYKGSYVSFLKKVRAAEKPSFTFPGYGGGIDIHKQIGKLPKLKGGWTLQGHKYTGPYNDLENTRRCVITNAIDKIWCSGLVEMQQFSKWNKGNNNNNNIYLYRKKFNYKVLKCALQLKNYTNE